jgi:hypothetical protein
MYADLIVARRISNYERSYSTRLREVSIPRVRELVKYLEGRRDPANPKRWLRPQVTPEFRAFIENELAMCKASFLYFAKRYCWAQNAMGDGGYKLFEPWEAQLLLLQKIASAEEYMWFRRDSGDPSYDGICYFIHKARQLGFTLLVQLLLLHRSLFYSDTRTLSVSLDDQKTQEVHYRWNAAYTRLPYWMQTGFSNQAVDRGKWLSNGSKVMLQDFSQNSGLGQGEQWDCAHLTEVGAVPDDYCAVQIENNFFPTIATSMRGMAFMESTAQGMGNWWHQSTELARKGQFGRWQYAFIPWYAEPTRWAKWDVHPDWKPNDDTAAHARTIELTSPEWMGYEYTPTRFQLAWYETNREAFRVRGALAEFLTNYCATPEESFQFSGTGAFNNEVIQIMSNRIDRIPVAYELGSPRLDRTTVRPDRNIISVGSYDLVPVYMSQADTADPRGLFLMYDYPRPDRYYSVGADSADGIAGWHRTIRTQSKEELRKDNAVTSTWYVDPDTGITRQAQEFAGPITPREFAIYCLITCRLYHGTSGFENGAPLILEIYPAVGGAQTQARLQYELGYYNFYRWKTFNGMVIKETNQWGWVSHQKSVRELWIKTKELAENITELPPKEPGELPSRIVPVQPQSRYMVYEMNYATWDPNMMRGRALSGYHDDRLSAAMFALWQLHDWSIPKPPPPLTISSTRQSNCLPGCIETRQGTKHIHECRNLPPEKWDWIERDLVTEEQRAAAVDEWIQRALDGHQYAQFPS